MEWLAQNWLIVAAIVYAAASEIIGANPAWKSNTVLGVVMGILGKILGKKQQ
jgi:hypothetical protein